jgi:hypothetical protein
MVRYCEEMLGIDWLVDRVTTELDTQGRLANTLMIFTSDNGMAWGAHRFGQEKAIPYASPVPLYMTWPARWGTEPRTVDEYASNIDLAPTLCAIAGCELGPYPGGQSSSDGVSLLRLLDGSVDRLDRTGLLESNLSGTLPWTAIRTTGNHPRGLWHYVEYSGGERELYDLAADPWELRNIAGTAGTADLMRDLAAELAALRQEGRPSGAPTATIRILLDSLPNNARDFAFTGALGGFVLDDDGNATRPRQRTFSGLAPGSYRISQTKVDGWSLVGLSCTPPEATDRSTLTATISLAEGEFVACTFTNALRRPDGSIATSASGTYKGGNVYSATPIAEQTQTRVGVSPGATYRYWVRLQNDSSRQDSFLVAGQPSGTSRMTVRYLVAGVDVSNAVNAGSFRIGPLAPGASNTMVVEIKVAGTAVAGDQKTVLVALRSAAEPSRVDVVRAIAVR